MKKWISVGMVLSLVVSLLSGVGRVDILAQAAGYGISNPTTSGGVTTWDCVWFGNYWQNDTNGDGTADQNDAKQPIKWRVLSVNGDDAFLLADQCLDGQKYNTEYKSVTWESCTIRTWLNQDFYSAAFSSAEQSAVKTTAVVNEDNPYYGTEGGNNTTDKVYLLSFSEVTNSVYGFSTDRTDDDKARYGKSTEYAKNQGAYVNTTTGNSWWWLRSPGGNSYDATDVYRDGYVGSYGLSVCSLSYGVRPALHLNLSSSQWSYAGTVSADGTGSETGADPSSGTETPAGDSSGLNCTASVTMEEGQTKGISPGVYAGTQEKMKTLSSNVQWTSSDTSVATVSSAGFVQSTSPAAYSSSERSYSLWWATGMVSVKGIKKGKATITGKLSDGTATTCEVTVEEAKKDTSSISDSGTGGSLTIGSDSDGAADSGSGVAQFFPDSWSMKSSKYPVQLSKQEKEDGSYKIKASIGIGRSNLLDDETEWSKYKKACETANKNSGDYDVLASYRDTFGLKTSTAIHSSGWSGSKPSLAVMGYVENEYDKNGNLIKASGKIAGDFEFKGGMSWQFATPIGPMYLKFEGSGKISLEAGPSWDNKKSKMFMDGSVTLTPGISLTGGYGIDKVASISATGKASFGAQVKYTVPAEDSSPLSSKGTLTAEASVNAQVLFVFDKTWTLAKYTKDFWNTSKNNSSKTASKNRILNSSGEEEDLSLMETDFSDSESDWSGAVKSSGEVKKKVLQEGVLPSTLPMMAEIGGKQVLVWQAYDSSRATANSTVLTYSVYENGVWSEPKAVSDDGCGDAYADLKVIGDQLYLTWQKYGKKFAGTDEEQIISQMAENSEIYFAEFDSDSNSFSGVKQVTDNSVCDMMPKFVEGTDSVQIAFVRNSESSILQSEGENSIYTVEVKNGALGTENLLTTSPGTIDRYVAYEQNESVKAMYVAQTNDIVAVLNSDNKPIEAWSDLMQMSEDGTISSLDYEDGSILALSGGTLYQYDLSDGTMTVNTAGSSAFDSNAVYCTNGTKSGYIWSSYDEGEKKGTIRASMKTDEGYSEPVVLYETSGEITRYMAPVLTSTGEWNMALNQENVDTNIHSLCYFCREESVDSHLVSATINENDKSGGKTGVDYLFTNDGDAVIEEITLEIKAEDGTTITKNLNVNIAPGETVYHTVYLDLSDIEPGQKVDISMCDSSQDIAEQNSVSDDVAATDVALIGTVTENDQGIQIQVDVSNLGDHDANVDVSLYSDQEMKNRLSERRNLSILKKGKQQAAFTVDSSAVEYNENDAAYLTVCADVEGGDYDTSNNVTYLVLYKGEKINANTAEKSEEISVTPTPVPDNTAEKTDDKNSGQDNQIANKTENVQNSSDISGNGTVAENTVKKPAKVKIKSAKNNKKKTVTVKWKKVSDATGYQLQYALNKKFTKAKKSKTTKKTSVTLKKLKKKKTYYIRVRAYKLSGKKKVYGKWSAVKKVKIKK